MTMRNRPTLLLDVDGVIADFETRFLALARIVTGRQIVRDPTHSDMGRQCALSEEEAREVWDHVRQIPFAREIDPYPIAVESVLELREIVNVYFVTAPMRGHPTWAHDREQWLRDLFGDLGQNVISTHHKYCVRGHIFVDDRTKHVDSWSRAHPEGQAFLWNKSYNSDSDLPRIKSWRELRGIVDRVLGLEGL